jgi:outer membrane protein TolC
MRNCIIRIFFLVGLAVLPAGLAGAKAQSNTPTLGTQILSFEEYLGYVKQFHPVAKQAQLALTQGQTEVLRAKGGFDPKLTADYERKDFKDLEYFDLLDAKFKVPTWYGIELQAGFERYEGEFVNEQNFVPEEGLFSAGLSVNLGKGFLINERMATLQKAKIFRNQTQAERDIVLNQVIFDASLAYFNWTQAYKDLITFEQFVANAEQRYKGIQKNAEVGESAQIDVTEALISFQNRQLSLEKAKVILFNTGMLLSNFLWLDNDTPLELENNVIPNLETGLEVDTVLQIEGQSLNTFTLDNHPKLQKLNFKLESLDVDKRLKANKLLPKLELNYNFLTSTPTVANSFQSSEYKGGINFSFPIFLRKERGELNLAKLKVRNTELDVLATEVAITNEVRAMYQELDSYERQNRLLDNIVSNYEIMLTGEERKFDLGESSIFLVNTREKNLIDARLDRNKLENSFFKTKAKLFKSIGVRPAL